MSIITAGRSHPSWWPIALLSFSPSMSVIRRPPTGSEQAVRGLTNRWSGRVEDKVPSPNIGARAAQLNR